MTSHSQPGPIPDPSAGESCLNCSAPLPADIKYCPSCGQRRTSGLISVKDILQDFFSTVFNLDSRLFRTLRDLCVPARLTRQYFAGKHHTYYSPLRLFFVSLILFLGAIGLRYANAWQEDISTQASYRKYLLERNTSAEIEDAVTSYTRLDSLPEQQRSAVDTFIHYLRQRTDRVQRSAAIALLDTTYTVPMREMHELSIEDILNKYQVTGTIDRLIARQLIKFQKQPERLTRFAIGNITWMLVLLVPVVALMMKLLYLGSSRYYIEHLVLQYHYHALAFLLTALCILLFPFWLGGWSPVLAIGLTGYLFVAMRRYYGQNRLTTGLKLVLLAIFYSLALVVFALVTLVISLLLFP